MGRSKSSELAPGDLAPDFDLLGSDGKNHRLADYRGQKAVVLAWFPKAFTPGCTNECKSVWSARVLLREFDVAYFTISCDTPEQNAKFAKSLELDYPVLSDPTAETAKAYGVVGMFRPWPHRWTFYIGTDGRILDIDKNVHTNTHGHDVAQHLEELGVAKIDQSK